MTENRLLRGVPGSGFKSPAPSFPQPQQGVTAKGGVRYWNEEGYEAVGWK
jgi:hypothetical protein